jgi:hypothetical protein
MFAKEGVVAAEAPPDWVGAFKAQLEAALADLEADKPDLADKRARALVSVLKAVREAAEFEKYLRANAPDEDIDALRAELRRRYARLVEGGAPGALPGDADPA